MSVSVLRSPPDQTPFKYRCPITENHRITPANLKPISKLSGAYEEIGSLHYCLRIMSSSKTLLFLKPLHTINPGWDRLQSAHPIILLMHEQPPSFLSTFHRISDLTALIHSSLCSPFWNQSNSRSNFPTLIPVCSNKRPKDVNVPRICSSFQRWRQCCNLRDRNMLAPSLGCKTWEALASLHSWANLNTDHPFPSAKY